MMPPEPPMMRVPMIDTLLLPETLSTLPMSLSVKVPLMISAWLVPPKLTAHVVRLLPAGHFTPWI